MTHVREIVADSLELLKTIYEKNQLTGVSTQFKDYDCLTGGLQSGELIVIAGRPSMGVSALCINLALNIGVFQKIPIVLFSLAVCREKFLQHMLCILTDVDVNRIRTGHLNDSDWRRFDQASNQLCESPIYIFDPSIADCALIFENCAKHQSESNLKLVVVDPIELLEPSHLNDSNRKLRDLKHIARRLNLPVIAATHIPDFADRADMRPNIRDLPGANLADTVAFLYRDEYYNPESAERGRAELILARQKSGPVGTINLNFHSGSGRFSNVPLGHHQ